MWPLVVPMVISENAKSKNDIDIGGLASSAQHNQGDGPTSSFRPVSMGKEQRAVCSGGLVIEVAVWLKLGGEGG